MKKIFMIVDSFSGLTKKEADALGYGYVPQIVIIDGKSYKDGIDIFMEDSVELIKNAKDFKTSMPPVGEIMDIIDENASKYDEIIYWPMNKGISSTFNTVSTVARDYKNVHVADVKIYSTPLQNVIKKSKEMLEKGSTIKKTFEYVETINEKTTSYMIPKDVSSMIKGGRIKGAKRAILEKGKLIPKLKWTSNGLKTTGIKRNFTKMIQKSIERMTSDISNSDNYSWELIHTGDLKTKKMAQKAIEDLGYKPSIKWVPPVVSVHLGIGGLGLMTYPKK